MYFHTANSDTASHRQHQNNMGMERQQESERTEPDGHFVSAELHGDVLEAVVTHFSALDLLSASLVSKSWRRAVLSSLLRSPRCAPRLLIHHHRSHSRANSNITTHAYDPRARVWVSFALSPSDALREDPLRCALPGGRLYALNSSRMAVSTDNFRSSWRVMGAPRLWRTDPVVAVFGPCVVVVGGVSEFEDEPRAVEMYLDGSDWRTSESMPEAFADSASATCLSVAASDRRLYIMERNLNPSGVWMSWFDPAFGMWGPTQTLGLPSDDEVQLAPAAIGYIVGIDRLVVVGIYVGTATSSYPQAAVTLWTVDEETLEADEEIGRMPKEMAEEGFGMIGEEESVGFCCDGGFGYIYKRSSSSSSIPKEFFLCEFEKANGKNKSRCRRWERVEAPATLQEEMSMHGVVIRCSMTGCLGMAMQVSTTVGRTRAGGT